MCVSPDQERAIDALIVAGKLDAAAEMYRTITGTALIGAKMYVYARNTALKAGNASTQAATPVPPPVRAPVPRAVNTQRKGGCGSLGVWIVVIIALFNLGKTVVSTRGFGMFTIVHASYYRELVTTIEREPKFQAQLGKPISVSDKDVWCTQVSSSSGGDQSSDCRLPVRGSRTPAGDGAYVEAQTAVVQHRVSYDLTLHVRNAEYHVSRFRRK